MAAQTVKFQRRTGSEILASLQTWYPDLTAVAFDGTDDSYTIDSSSELSNGDRADIQDYLASTQVWKQLEI